VQFGHDFEPLPSTPGDKIIGNEYSLLHPAESWIYDHTWESSSIGKKYNWKTFADGFQECYHCATGHASTLPRILDLKDYYVRQGIGASRHFLPQKKELAEEISESFITWLYPLGAVVFSDDLFFIQRFDARGALETRYQSETYRRKEMRGEGEEHKRWMEDNVGGWRFIESEDIDLAEKAQKGFMNGVLGRGRLHPVQG
jgi:hypothetical protein